jgi:antitoxin Phd
VITRTSAEAQNKFGELLDLAQREPVAITRHGRAAAFLVSPRDMNEIINSREERKRAVAELKAWRLKYKDQISPEASNLTMEEINRMVHELR